LWCAASLVGGFIYGAMRRGVSELVLAALIGVCTIPVGLFGASWWVLSLAIVPAGMLCAPTLAALADAVSRLAPVAVRGLVMGVHGSALTVGLAVGAPLSGAVVDASAPVWAFVVVGAAGALLATAALGICRRPMVARPPVVDAERAHVTG
jgi:predicted MFS family arabinose efflux permease